MNNPDNQHPDTSRTLDLWRCTCPADTANCGCQTVWTGGAYVYVTSMVMDQAGALWMSLSDGFLEKCDTSLSSRACVDWDHSSSGDKPRMKGLALGSDSNIWIVLEEGSILWRCPMTVKVSNNSLVCRLMSDK